MFKRITIIMACLAVLLMASSCTSKSEEELAYESAVEALAAGEYEEVISLLSGMEDYEDAESLISESYYYMGLEAFDAEDYELALSYFEASDDQEDAANKMTICYYSLAEAAVQQADYDSAITYFALAGDYEDSAEMLTYCTKEKGMTENADYAFLTTIEESILWRMSSSSDTSRSILVATELAYVEKYATMDFYDSNLKELADQYINGLYIQAEALTYEAYYQYQIAWQEGTVERYTVLAQLYYDYDFLTDNAEFIGTYISQLDYQVKLLNAYNAIEDDLSVQLADPSVWTSSDYYYITATLQNNTEYTYTTYFIMTFYDLDMVQCGTGYDTIEGIKPGTSYVVSIYIPDSTTDTFNITFENYYSDISWSETTTSTEGN